MPPPSAAEVPGLLMFPPLSSAVPPAITKFSKVTLTPLAISNTRSRACWSMTVWLGEVPMPSIINGCFVLLMFRSPVCDAVSWPDVPLGRLSTYVVTVAPAVSVSWMVSVVVPVSALSAMMAARRLPARPSVTPGVRVVMESSVRSSMHSNERNVSLPPNRLPPGHRFWRRPCKALIPTTICLPSQRCHMMRLPKELKPIRELSHLSCRTKPLNVVPTSINADRRYADCQASRKRIVLRR